MIEYEDEQSGDYIKIFELGLYQNVSPACKVLEETEICPITLAALSVALFETAMKSVPESDQIQFEKIFRQSFEVMLEERYEYDVITKYPNDEQ
jgi:hypothetical protein